MTETPEERAKRLGLTGPETPEARAQRLGLGQSGSLKLDVRAPSESTGALPFNRPSAPHSRAPNPIPGLASAPAGLAKIAQEPETQQATLGLLSGASQIGPVKMVQAALRAATRGQSYREALSDIEQANAKVPGEIRAVSQLPATAALAPLLPANPAVGGAIIGAADQAFDANPDRGMGSRAFGAAVGAAGGAMAGKIADAGSTLGRAALTTTPGAAAIAKEEARNAAAFPVYRQAAREGTRAGASPSIQNVLQQPDIKPYADMVRDSRQFANADDARVLREVFKLMGKQEGGLKRQLTEQGFDAVKAMQKDNIAAAKQELLNVADPVMPSFRPAVQAFAEGSAVKDAVGVGRDAASRAIGRTSAKNLTQNSREALVKRIEAMPPDQRSAAVEGILGRLKESVGPQPNAVSLGGALTTAVRPARISHLLRDVGDPGAMKLSDWIKTAMLAWSAH